jgi:predicted negative regulator of RcsB-dependent stress response
MRPMEKSERHHIKENDFQLIIERGYDWLQKYKREVFYGIGIVVAMVVLWYGWNAFSGSRESHASQLLAQALGGDKVDMEKVKRVASKYSGLPAGRSAQALLAIQEGKAPKETAAALEDLIPKVKDATFKGVLIFNSVLLTAEGKDAAGALKMLDTYKDQIPGEMALLLQGRVLEIEGKNDEAKALYNRMMKEYPESSLRYMAQQRMNVL